ncbi:hypothetical protein IFM89_011456, partial [Coptis chinensis]
MQLNDETVKNSNAAVLIVTSASVKYKDENAEYVLSSTAATMLYLNLQIPRVADIINSPIPASRTLLLPEPPQAPPGITAQRKTLSDIIASVNDASSKQMLFTCEATISQILHDKGWSYNACPRLKCLKAVDITSNGYTCMNHEIVSPEQRYQLRMEIKDDVSIAKVVAFRPKATTLLQKTEEELARIESQDTIFHTYKPELNLNMRSDGYVRVSNVLNLNMKTFADILIRSHTVEDIREAVGRDNKQRFSLLEENDEQLICANQGHTVK